MKKAIALIMLAVGLIAVSTVRAHEKVKLTGYVVDVVCAADHTKDYTAGVGSVSCDERIRNRRGIAVACMPSASMFRSIRPANSDR